MKYPNEHHTHLTLEQLNAYRTGSCPMEIIQMIDRHLTLCFTCHERLQGRESLNEEGRTFLHRLLVRALDTPIRHFSYRRVVAYVDGELNESEREMADGHLADCSLCRLQVSELRAFKAELRKSPAIVQPDAKLVARKKGIGFSSAWLSWNAWRARGETLAPIWSLVALATALVLALAVSLFLLVSFTRRPKTPEQQAGGAPPLQSISKLGPAQLAEGNDNRHAQEQSRILREKGNTHTGKPEATPSAVTLNDGPGQLRLEVDRPLETLETVDHVTRGLVLVAFNNQRINKPESLRELEPSREFRGSDPDLALSQENSHLKYLSPVNVVLREDQPTFRWVPHPDAVAYRVRVFDDQDRKITESPLLPPVDNWQPGTKLPRARQRLIYSWKLIAVLGDGQELVARTGTGPPKFIVLGEDNLERLQKLERSYPGYHMLLGIAYADAGLTALAEPELARLQKANPKSAFAARLLGSVRSWSKVK